MKQILIALGFFCSFSALTKSPDIKPYDLTLKQMKEIANSSAFITSFDLGRNDQGKMIKGLRFTGALASKHHLIVGSHHGNEVHSVDAVLEFARLLKTIYENPNHLHYQKFQSYSLSIIPALNITGYNIQRREEKDQMGKWRDPNRDYPDPCAEKNDFYLKSTKFLADYLEEKNIISAITVHGYIGTFTYPWGIHTDNYSTKDQDFLAEWAELASRATGYQTGTHGKVIYPAAGAFEDFAYFRYGIWSYLSELDYNPDLKANAESYLEFFAHAPSVRSINNQHTGNCTRTKDFGIGRP